RRQRLRVTSCGPGGTRLDSEFPQEAARPARPGHVQVLLRSREPDVEQPPLLGERRASSALAGQLTLLDARQEDSLELESLCTMQRQQMDAAHFHVLPETGLEVGDERAHCAPTVIELARETDDPREVALPRLLA